MRVKNLIYKIVLFFLPSVAVFQGGSLDRYMLGESKFTYEGYTLERTITEEKNIYYSRITLKKGDAVIREFPRAQNGKKDRGGVHLGSILKTLLPLIYSGQEKEAWKYFENDYVMPDKWGMQEKIRLRLLTDPVYKYIEQQGKEVERSLNIKP